MKVNEARIAQALDRPDDAPRLYFLYGADDAGIRALADRLDRALGAGAERVELDGATLKDDPARLVDEAASFSLFGERRYVRVTGNDECTAAVQALLESEVAGNPVVVLAGTLKPTSPLLKLVLDHPAVMAFQTYRPDVAALETLAVAIGRASGLRLQPGVAARLAVNALGDRAVLASEIDKLALYLDAAPDRPREATEDALAAIGADLADIDTARFVNAVLDGNLPAVTGELVEIGSTNGWVPALRALQRRLILLARLRADVDTGKSPAAAVAALGKAVFWKDQPLITAQVARWPGARLATAASRLFASERALMASGTAGPVIVADEFVVIARVGQRLR